MGQGYDLAIRGGVVVRPHDEPCTADIGIRDGRIAALTAPGAVLEAEREVDASGLHVLPGAVDPHAHIAMGGGLDEYGPDTGAAALGGVTSVFYILIHAGAYDPLVREHRAVADEQARIDYAFHLTLMTDAHAEELPALWDRHGINSYKYYMSFRGEEGAYLGVEGTDDGAFDAIIAAVAGQAGGVLAVHPENIEIVWRLRDRLMAAGRDDLRAWNESRPPFTEAESVSRAAFLAARLHCPLYFVHLSSALALRELRSARARFPETPMYGETCPHFLTHTEESAVGVLGKVNPPLRGADDPPSLWGALADGTIDTVGSDHVGRRREAKQGTIWKASAGFPGLPTTLPVLLSEGYHRGRLSLPRIAELTAWRPARIFGVGDRKGDIRVGHDADLALVDLQLERRPTADWLGTYADYSLYEDWTLKGWPRYTLVRGEIVQQDGALAGDAVGRYLDRRTHEHDTHG